MAKRVYQVWKGRNRFSFKGRLIFGPDAKSLVITLLLVVVPIGVFCTSVARNLVHQFPTHNAGYLIPVVGILFTIYATQRYDENLSDRSQNDSISLPDLVSVSLFSYVFISLFHYTFGLFLITRDPGIVPRNLNPPEEEICYDSSASVDFGGRQTPTPRIPRTKEVSVNGFTVKVKYCDTCMIYRPPRCSHCSVCDNCVERFDHHCPWVGQCIGLRNYCYFFLFVSSLALLCIFVFAMSALNIKFLMDDYGTVRKAMKESPASMILMGYSFIFLWFVGGLTCFHLYLIARNQTTYENFRYGAANRHNVYDRGCLKNFLEVFCTKTKPCRNNFRAYVQEQLPVRITREVKIDDADGDSRAKVQGNLEIDNDLLKISQRRDAAEAGSSLS